MRRLLVLLSGCFLLSAGLCWGGTIYVKPDGTGDAPTIGAAMDSAAVGDTLLLASGTFSGVGNRDLDIPDKNLVIMSETGDPDDCAIDFGRNVGFYFESGTAAITGITMANADWSALCVWTVGSTTSIDLRVRDCVFSNCEGEGSGISLSCYGEVRITGCKFLSNVGGMNGAVDISAQGFLEAWIDSCTFCSNTAYCGAAISCTMLEMIVSIRNSVFCHNSAGSAGGAIAWAESCPDIRRCTFFANSAPAGSAIAGGYYAGCRSCIIAYGEGGCPIDVGDPLGDPWASCTNIYGNEGGDWMGGLAGDLGQNGNFSACPGFCYWEMEPYDLHLCSSSPCLPGNHPNGVNCGLIGALGQGCDCGPSEVEPITWGAIKAMYK